MTSTRNAAATAQREAKPTPKQLQTLNRLAQSRGQSFAYPKTKAQASREIRRLMAAAPQSRYEHARERAVARQLPVTVTDAAAVRDDEVTGYGSTARWAAAIGDVETAALAAPWEPQARRARIAAANAASNRRADRR